MSKKNDITLLLPGATGWQIWQGTPEQGFNLDVDRSPAATPSEIDKLPSGALTMGFPVREALAVPFKAATEDDAMFEDLAEMHLEQSGIRPDVDAGRLTDVFLAGKSNDQSLLLNVVLAAPAQDAMPLRSPKDFDISARFFPMEADAVTLWRELGRWVFAVTRNSHLIYFQSLAGAKQETSFASDVSREINLALTQLALQGITVQPERVVVWDELDSGEIESLSSSLKAEVITSPKPRPVSPQPISKLVPANVRAERYIKAQKQKRNLLIAAITIAYLGIAGYFGYEYYKLHKQHKEQQKVLASYKQEHDSVKFFIDDWETLAPVVDQKQWHLNILANIVKRSPANLHQLSLSTVEIKSDGTVSIKGNANELKTSGKFGSDLKKYMKDFNWHTPSALQNKKNNRWEFHYTANPVSEQPTQ